MRPLYVYLDQNHWIHLSQDYYQRNKSTSVSYKGLIEKIFLAANQNRAIFPLSVFHIAETLLASDVSKQERLFQFASKICNGWVIATPWNIVPLELEISISGMSGHVNVFKKLDSLQELHSYLFHAEENRKSTKVYRDKTNESAQRNERARIRKDGKPYSREFLRFTYTRNLILHIQNELFTISQKYNIDVDKLVEKLGLFENVPVLDVQLTLTSERDQDLSKPISPNDIADLSHISVAIPYCDVVVPDGHWAHLTKIKRLGLEKKYGTKVLEKLSQLENYL